MTQANEPLDYLSAQMRERELRDQRQHQQLLHALGQVGDLLAEDDMCEVMLNPDGTLWVERLGQPMTVAGRMAEADAMRFLTTLANMIGVTITPKNPRLAGELPIRGERVQAGIPPLVAGPYFSIRKPASKVFTLDQYLERGIMTPAMVEAIRRAVREHKNIVVAGGTGSGKTTLCNAVLHYLSTISTHERVVIIEDTRELQCSVPNLLSKRTRKELGLGMFELLVDALRERPDRILVGEVREAQPALTLLDVWNTGHPGGVCTIHADSARKALTRLNSLVMRNNVPAQHDLVAEAVNVVIYIERDPQVGRRVKEIIEVQGWDRSAEQWLVKDIV